MNNIHYGSVFVYIFCVVLPTPHARSPLFSSSDIKTKMREKLFLDDININYFITRMSVVEPVTIPQWKKTTEIIPFVNLISASPCAPIHCSAFHSIWRSIYPISPPPPTSVITHNHPRACLNWKINQDFSSFRCSISPLRPSNRNENVKSRVFFCGTR